MYVPAPEPENKHRPSLLVDTHRLTPQESLESPHCTDVHFLPGKVGEAETVVPKVSVYSPPLSLELPNPLTSQAVASSVANSGDNGSMALPLRNPLATTLRSPPMELLLSPQYYSKPTARKIFSVSRVMETSPASPTVSKTGVLDTGATGVSNTPAMKLSGGGGGSRAGGAPFPVSPTLLCQDLSVKTVNDYIQQIVSDSAASPDGCEETQQATSLINELCIADDPMEGRLDGGREQEMKQDQDGGDILHKGQGVISLKEEEGYGDLDPLGVMQAQVPPLSGEVTSSVGCVASSVDCDSVKGNSGGSSQVGGACSDSVARSLGVAGENVTVQSECDAVSDGGEISVDKASCGEVFDLVNAVTGTDIQSIPVLSDVEPPSGDLSSASNHIPRQDPSVPDSQVAKWEPPADAGGSKAQSLSSSKDGDAGEELAECALLGKTKAGSTKTNTAEQTPFQDHGARPASPQAAEESPLFKTMEFPDFAIDEEDLSLFGASGSETAPSPSLSANQGVESDKESIPRESSPGLGDTWLAVDVPSLMDQQMGGRAEGGEKQPDFFTALSLNGLTQELASALNSIDESCIGFDNQGEPGFW